MIIKGSLDNLQSSLDFYLSITSKNLIVDLKEMKKRFFEIFKEEDSYRKENFLMFQERVSDDYAIAKDVEPVLVGEEECFAFGNFSFAEEGTFEDIENNYPSDSEVYISNEGYVEDDDDEFISYGSNSNDLENENSSFYSYSSNLETENIKSENKSNYLEEENNYLEEENTLLENETNSVEIERSELETESEDLDDDDFIDYSSSENKSINLETEKITSTSNIYEGTFYDSEFKEEEEEEFSWGSYEDSEYSSEELHEEVQEEEEYFGWGSYENSEYLDNEVKEGTSQDSVENIEEKTIIDSKSSWGNFDVEEFLNDNTSSIKGINIEESNSKNKVVDFEEDIEVPRDLRDFVKLYHNCEMSFALQYFTKKDIDKQLSLGRVFKRKNRLLI